MYNTANTNLSLSPIENLNSDSSLSSENQLSNSENPQINGRKREVQEAKSSTESENEKMTVSNNDAKVEAVRPMNLYLFEHELKPSKLKHVAKLKQSKRENRLLSVPNLKFSKNETTVCDLRCEQNAISESFTCNLIKRFSKCLYVT